jgi:hypothetical protein
LALLECVQSPEERHKLIRADELDPERCPGHVDVNVDHIRQLNRARNFPGTDSNVERIGVFADAQLHLGRWNAVESQASCLVAEE